jgi:hypothetical protein
MADEAFDRDRLELDKQRLELDFKKHSLEQARFDADIERRRAEVEKIGAETQKLKRETDDLAVPYRRRPAYVTAWFQGIAAVVALAGALYSLGSINAVLVAERQRREAEAAKEKAEEAKKEADDRKEKAEADAGAAKRLKESAEMGLKAVQAQTAEQSKLLAQNTRTRAESIIEAIGNEPKELPKALTELFEDDQAHDAVEAVMRTYAFNVDEPVLLRFRILEYLYEQSDLREPSAKDQARLKEYRPILLSTIDHTISSWELVPIMKGLDDLFGEEVTNQNVCLVLLCYKRLEQQKGQQGSRPSRARAILMRSVAMDCGLCRSARARRAAGLELGRNFRGA